MAEVSQRTVLCSVVFVDIVGYSKQPVAQQGDWKVKLNQFISSALQSIQREHRVILDTGDGAALCFLGSPEDALGAALDLVKSCVSRNPGFQVRTGINLGSVKIVRDLNDQPNVIGDGINVAQRIMSFAGDGQIYSSRSFYEVISCISCEHSALFESRGEHRDKHSRAHEVFEVRVDTSNAFANKVATCEAQKKHSQWCDPNLAEQLERLLARFLGPMAKFLVKKSIDTVSGPEELLETLQSQLLNPLEQADFAARFQEIFKLSGLRGSSSPVELTPEAIDQIEKCLAEWIGPMAKILTRKAVASGLSKQQVLEKLAQEVPAGKDREKFLEQVK